MGNGKNLIEEAIRYQRSRTEGCELSSQNRAEVRGYTVTCNMYYRWGPFFDHCAFWPSSQSLLSL